jgi:hypothetical protein
MCRIREHEVYRWIKGPTTELCVVVDVVGDGTVWVEWCDSDGQVSNVKEKELKEV